jgi:hypothetical protein
MVAELRLSPDRVPQANEPPPYLPTSAASSLCPLATRRRPSLVEVMTAPASGDCGNRSGVGDELTPLWVTHPVEKVQPWR